MKTQLRWQNWELWSRSLARQHPLSVWSPRTITLPTRYKHLLLTTKLRDRGECLLTRMKDSRENWGRLRTYWRVELKRGSSSCKEHPGLLKKPRQKLTSIHLNLCNWSRTLRNAHRWVWLIPNWMNTMAKLCTQIRSGWSLRSAERSLSST